MAALKAGAHLFGDDDGSDEDDEDDDDAEAGAVGEPDSSDDGDEEGEEEDDEMTGFEKKARKSDEAQKRMAALADAEAAHMMDTNMEAVRLSPPVFCIE